LSADLEARQGGVMMGGIIAAIYGLARGVHGV
jgi:hypothetical protein